MLHRVHCMRRLRRLAVLVAKIIKVTDKAKRFKRKFQTICYSCQYKNSPVQPTLVSYVNVTFQLQRTIFLSAKIESLCECHKYFNFFAFFSSLNYEREILWRESYEILI